MSIEEEKMRTVQRGFWSHPASTGRNGGAPARHSRAASEDTEAGSERATRLLKLQELLLALSPASHRLLLHTGDQLSTNTGTDALFLEPELSVPALAQALLAYRTSCQRTLQLLTPAWTQERQDKFVEKDASEAVEHRHYPSDTSTQRNTYMVGGSTVRGSITGLISSSLVIYSGHCENSKTLCQML